MSPAVANPARLTPELAAEYPFESRFLAVDGGRLHYVDEGPRDAPVVLCLHGNPTWSFYWRALVRRYSGAFRVVVPDHIGCGLSDKPQGWPYRLRGHVDNVLRVIDALDLKQITLVVHDWGGAIGMGVATLRPELIERFVVTNTGAWRSLRIPPSIASCKIPGFGAVAVRGFNGFAGVATLRATARGLSPVAKAGLLMPYDSWANRIATLRFVQDIPLHPMHPSYAELGRIDDTLGTLRSKPMLICWGDQDFCFTPAFRAEWQRRFPDATVHAWPDVGHYVMEDAPERVIAAMDAFLP